MTDAVENWLSRHRPEVRLSLQMTVAGLAAFAVGHLLGLNQIYWAVLTAVIVMQASVGGSLKASLDRFCGTIAGAAWGVAVSVAVPHESVWALGGALALALTPLAVTTALWPRYRVALVTAAIVLLGASGSTGVTAAALDRVFEIGLGSLVALAVALAVMPSRAHRLLLEAAQDALTRMGELSALLLAGIANGSEAAAVQDLHDRIRAAIERAVAIADEVLRERSSHLADAPDPEPLVRTLRRLSHDLVTIGHALPTALPEPVQTRLAEPAAALAISLNAAFDRIGDALAAARAPPRLDAVAAALEAYGEAMQGLRRDGETRGLSDADVERVFGLAFALEQLRRNLDELASRAGEAVGKPGRPAGRGQNPADSG